MVSEPSSGESTNETIGAPDENIGAPPLTLNDQLLYKLGALETQQLQLQKRVEDELPKLQENYQDLDYKIFRAKVYVGAFVALATVGAFVLNVYLGAKEVDNNHLGPQPTLPITASPNESPGLNPQSAPKL